MLVRRSMNTSSANGKALLAFGLAGVVYVLAGLAGRYRGPWYEDLVRPPLLPRRLECSIALIWAVIFAGMGLALARFLAAQGLTTGPYLLWGTFATYVTYLFHRLNPPT